MESIFETLTGIIKSNIKSKYIVIKGYINTKSSVEDTPNFVTHVESETQSESLKLIHGKHGKCFLIRQ